MRLLKAMAAVLFLSLTFAHSASADAVSYTGTLASPTDIFSLVFNVGGAGSQTVSLQTWGFGGGVNAAGQTISAGGFDPFVSLFSGTGTGATILTDGMGNPFGTSDVLSNFSDFAGCPPGATVGIGGAVCGDITMSLSLLPGTYTVILSDGLNIANAVFDNGTLSEGFTDFTGGAFQTCNGVDANGNPVCVTDTANWAFDLTTGGSTVPTPEPASLLLLGTGLLGVGWWHRRKLPLEQGRVILETGRS